MKPFLFAANWKMYLSAYQEQAFAVAHNTELSQLAQTHQATIALFPSFVSLQTMSEQLKNSPIKLGAQDCSAKNNGALTGQIPASSLAEVGCVYTIIGHSERRACNEDENLIAEKAARLFEHNICPIICIGETAQEREHKETISALTKQITPLLPVFAAAQKPFYLAYEPVWAIGTGATPTPQEIGAVFNQITMMLEQNGIKNGSLLYGGSVTAATAPQLYAIPRLDGFLIGGASIDFQEFKKIVVSKHS